PMPARRASSCPGPSGRPSTDTTPASGRSAGARPWARVDLPAPLSPTRATISPASIRSDVWSRTWSSPNRLHRPSTTSSGGRGAAAAGAAAGRLARSVERGGLVSIAPQCACRRTPVPDRLLLVALDDVGRAHGGLVGGLARLPPGPGLAEQVPALVEGHLDGLQPLRGGLVGRVAA